MGFGWVEHMKKETPKIQTQNRQYHHYISSSCTSFESSTCPRATSLHVLVHALLFSVGCIQLSSQKLVQYQMLTIQRALVRLTICIASLFYVSMTHMQASTSSTSLIPSSITAQSTGGAFKLICQAMPVRRRTSRRRSAPAAPALQ